MYKVSATEVDSSVRKAVPSYLNRASVTIGIDEEKLFLELDAKLAKEEKRELPEAKNLEHILEHSKQLLLEEDYFKEISNRIHLLFFLLDVDGKLQNDSELLLDGATIRKLRKAKRLPIADRMIHEYGIDLSAKVKSSSVVTIETLREAANFKEFMDLYFEACTNEFINAGSVVRHSVGHELYQNIESYNSIDQLNEAAQTGISELNTSVLEFSSAENVDQMMELMYRFHLNSFTGQMFSIQQRTAEKLLNENLRNESFSGFVRLMEKKIEESKQQLLIENQFSRHVLSLVPVNARSVAFRSVAWDDVNQDAEFVAVNQGEEDITKFSTIQFERMST
ncbi:hypothetical protein [Alkalicoccus chagannorensis]|uniref:hypothetical protein n=1 Tax=Alkalicoccus chagannorensis TaxID=427072 RepID=UPI00041B48B3|nr:hypothetical protein [Alkalicoccus chagannorensis]